MNELDYEWMPLHEAMRLLEKELGSFIHARDQLLEAFCERKIVTRAETYAIRSRAGKVDCLKDIELDTAFWERRKSEALSRGFKIDFSNESDFTEYNYDESGTLNGSVTIMSFIVHLRGFQRTFPDAAEKQSPRLIELSGAANTNDLSDEGTHEEPFEETTDKYTTAVGRMTSQKSACQHAFSNLFPEALPTREMCTDQRFIEAVQKYLTEQKSIIPSGDTILREAGRKKR